jgi:hypothetical protein
MQCGGGGSCPVANGAVCGGNGRCNVNTNNCECNSGYFGPACTCNPTVTCKNGICNDTTGVCTCKENYYGNNCQTCKEHSHFFLTFSDCDPAVTCTGNGICSTTGTCICNTYHFGSTCNVFCDPKITCSSHGECINPGICLCSVPYTGSTCSKYNCDLLSDSCSDCLSYSGICSWCENQNQCLDKKRNCPEGFLSECSSKKIHILFFSFLQESCTSLDSNTCANGDHCNCAGCGGSCYYYNGTGTPNACQYGYSWRCDKPSSSTSSSSSSSGNVNPDGKGLGPGAVSGIVIASVVVVGAVGGAGFFLWKKRSQAGYEPIKAIN